MLAIKRRNNEGFALIDRKTGQTLATVNLYECHENSVKAGIDAGQDILILRKELLPKKAAAETAA